MIAKKKGIRTMRSLPPPIANGNFADNFNNLNPI